MKNSMCSMYNMKNIFTGGLNIYSKLTVYLLIKLPCYLICIYRQIVILYYTSEDDSLEDYNAPRMWKKWEAKLQARLFGARSYKLWHFYTKFLDDWRRQFRKTIAIHYKQTNIVWKTVCMVK